MNDRSVLPAMDGPSMRQRRLRRRASTLPLTGAVRLAARAFFRFRYRGVGTALWSDAERVWLGRETFLHWAFWDADINIPWVVATTADAPGDKDELREVVRAELVSYWAACVDCLPQKKSPGWWPLP